MKGKSLFERDFSDAEEHFPKLKYSWNAKTKMWVIVGELDICDTTGVYWNTFDIILLVPSGYPYCVPALIEKSKIIPRNIDWHISSEGVCCIDIEHNLLAMSKVGINLTDFISKKIYSFMANQLYKLENNHYAGNEYAHRIEGVIQYYIEDLGIPTSEAIVKLIKSILNKSSLGRNDKCPCGSNLKIKNCHQKSIDIMKTLGNNKIGSDVENILKYIEKSN